MKKLSKICIGLFLALVLTVSTPGALYSGVSNRIVTAAASTPRTTENKVTLYKGHKTYQIGIEKLGRSAIVTFKSSAPKIAKVSNSGIITPKAVGSAVITVTMRQNKKTYISKINVTVSLSTIKFSAKPNSLVIGDIFTFDAETYGINGAISWSVSDQSIARIDEKSGKFTALKAGEVEVTVTAGSFSNSCMVVVKDPKLVTSSEQAPSPSPSPTSLPVPAPTYVPIMIPPTPIPVPTSTPTPVPVATPTPVPVATTPSPVPIITLSPMPIITPLPTPDPFDFMIPTIAPIVLPTPEPIVIPTVAPIIIPTPEPIVYPTPDPNDPRYYNTCICGFISYDLMEFVYHIRSCPTLKLP